MSDAEKINTTLTTVDSQKEYLCNACLCRTCTVFQPKDFVACIGQTSKSLTCCIDTANASCIFTSHAQFEELIQGDKEDVQCICCTGQSSLVKPLCLTGEKPVLKGVGQGCCCSNRMSIPSDADAPCQCAAYGAKCCTCFPFATDFKCFDPVDPLPATSMPASVELEEANMGTEFLLCAFGCGMCTMYIPDTRTDAFGVEDRSMCCCCTSDQKLCMLPKDAAGYEVLTLNSGQIKMIKPPVLKGGACCKGVTRNFFTITKFALPCDEEVPFAISCCFFKCVEKVPSGQLEWCKDDREADQATGLKPIFPELTKGQKVESPTFEATDPELTNKEMQRD